jgi:thioester reductase-like protein
MGHILLTGASGLLGQYLLADLLRAEVETACLVRPGRMTSARERIDRILRRIESNDGHAYRRPVVLAGDLSQPELGLGSAELAWIRRSCTAVLHSAASLDFDTNARTGEPHRTNVVGTRRLVDLAAASGITEFHHISTAYVCGRRSPDQLAHPVLEDADDAEIIPSNDYERSKLEAEAIVRGARSSRGNARFRSVTVYRPSIIVGDSRNGFTSTYQGFYSPLFAGYTLAKAYGFAATVGEPFLTQMGMVGTERKNFVPVDWVSSVITHILARPELFGRTYHLTSPKPISVAELDEVFTRAIAEVSPAESKSSDFKLTRRDPTATARRSEADEQAFRDNIAVYRSYFRDDPTFDNRNAAAAAPHLPCPELHRDRLLQLCRFALKSDFGKARQQLAPTSTDAASLLERTLVDSCEQPLAADRDAAGVLRFGLIVTGSGGGEWTVELADDGVASFDAGIASLRAGLASDVSLRCRINSSTLFEAIAGATDVRRAQHSGRLLIEGVPISNDADPRAFEERVLSSLDRLLASLRSGASLPHMSESPFASSPVSGAVAEIAE